MVGSGAVSTRDETREGAVSQIGVLQCVSRESEQSEHCLVLLGHSVPIAYFMVR